MHAPATTCPGPAAPLPSRERLVQWLHTLGEGLLDRELQVRLALLAVLAGEHVLLIGPPGTAKSALARRLHQAFQAAPYFERLLTRFSTPEELFGPLSLKALEDDRYERLTAGYLPEAGIAFLDEIFKANSAILNALLTLLNERCFDNGVQRLPVPLLAVVGASNELPGDESLQAFHDRFLLRVPVQPLGDAHFAALLALRDEPPAGQAPAPQALSPEERQALRTAAAGVALGAGFVQACAALRHGLAGRGWAASDRRWRQFAHLARVQAASEGRAALDTLDLWLAPYVFSPQPDAVPALQAWFVEQAAAAPPAQAPWLERAVQAFEKQLEIEQRAQAEEPGGAMAGDGAGKLALARAIRLQDPQQAEPGDGAGTEGHAMPRLLSERLQAQLRRRYSPLHISARLAQLEEIILPLLQQQATLAAELAALQTTLATRLWLLPALAAELLARHQAALALIDTLLQRLHRVRAGFAELPCDPGHQEPAPAPVHWAPAASQAAAD